MVLESHLAQAQTIVLTAYLTVGLSVFAHGVSASPLTGRYAAWLSAHSRETLSDTELAHAPALRVRGSAQVKATAARP